MEIEEMNDLLIYIWGTGELGRYAAKTLIEDGYSVGGFIDNNPLLTELDGISVIEGKALSQCNDLQAACVLITTKSAKNTYSILEQLESCAVANVGILKPQVQINGSSILSINGEADSVVWYLRNGVKFNVIPRLELNLADGCNLKCKGCTHFSSIFPDDSVYPLEDYKKDLIKLRTIGKMVRLRILGGEPFLVPTLDQYMYFTRDIFPETDIEIVTNGLLIPKLEEHILKSIKETGARITISLYPPTSVIKQHIVETLNKKKIPWEFTKEVREFMRSLTVKNIHNALEAERGCLSSGCIFLHRGKIYKCPVSGLINRLEEEYGINFEKKDEGIDLRGEKDIEKLNHMMKVCAINPSTICEYCAEQPEAITWQVKGRPELRDWLYKDGKV